MRTTLFYLLLAFTLFPLWASAQDISLYEQFNGRYDFLFFGNTMNPGENSYMVVPEIGTSSSADFALNPGNEIEAAYLYWAGCGLGDFNVQLNGNAITAERTFSYQRISGGETFDYFSAFTDVTALVQSTGNATYTLSGLDVTGYIEWAFQTRTNFAGWAIIVVYKNDALPLNQLNVYDGMQAVPDDITINLNSLNVIDNVGAKIGFLAWEGDENIATEQLTINNAVLSNPISPANNAFNGTNSFTGSEELYNMDLDVYNIQGYINIGDTTAQITLGSTQDFVMVNAVVTKLNSQLPDATIVADNVSVTCNSRAITVEYTVYNVNATETLPAQTPIAFYVGGVLVGTAQTVDAIGIGGSESGQITLAIPENLGEEFTLVLSADDSGTGTGIVTELNENNNAYEIAVALLPLPIFNQPENAVSCNEGLTAGTFDISDYANLISANPGDVVTFYASEENAINGTGEILDLHNFHADATPFTIWFRVQGDPCYNIGNFDLTVKNCPPKIYNFISSNGDGINDYFHVDGLRDIFMNHRISIFNRWGALIWTGGNSDPEWDGRATKGLKWSDGNVPDGTYYYVLDLNDPGYPEPYVGFLYILHN